MTEDRARAERARALLETCGLASEGMAPAEAVRRADEIAAAAAAYAGRAAEAQAAVAARRAPSGRPVEAPVAAVVGVRDGRVTHEHIYWDQASILVQVGALDPAGLPVTGAEQARKMLDLALPPNRLIPGWAQGEAG